MSSHRYTAAEDGSSWDYRWQDSLLASHWAYFIDFDIAWKKPADGFRWVSAAPSARQSTTVQEKRFLVPNGDSWTRYAVIRHRRKLLNEFLGLAKAVTEERILEFANQWGHLGVDEDMLELRSEKIWGQSLRSWQRHIAVASGINALWKRVQSGDVEFLRKFIIWGGPNSVTFKLAIRYDGLITKDITDSDQVVGHWSTAYWASSRWKRQLRRWQEGDVLEPARYVVCRWINEALRGQMDRVILPYYDDTIRNSPNSLMAAIFSQLQDEIAGMPIPEKICRAPGCPHRSFFPRRRDQIWCSDRCRKHYSQVMRRAKQK